MGKNNNVLNRYFSDKRRFADLFNGVYFNGNCVIKPENLEEASEVYNETLSNGQTHGGKREHIERVRDIKMRLKSGETLTILAIENQNQVDYSMPFRCMQYDTMEYGRQLEQLRKKNQEQDNFESWAERCCKIKKNDRLAPVYTLCIYHGEEPWDGSRSLRDMMDFGEDADGMSNYFADYPMRLLCLNEEMDYSVFHTEIRKLFQIMPYRKNKKRLIQLLESSAEYRHMDIEIVETLAVILNDSRIWEDREKYMIKDKQEEYDMCQAWKELLEDARNEGIQKGIQSLIEVCKTLGATWEMVRDALMEKFQLSMEDAQRYMQMYW